MKFLLENWRGYLNERATDETYSEVINFIINAYSTAKNFEPPDVEKREAEWDAIAKILGSEDGWASLGLQAKDDVEKEPPEKQLVTHMKKKRAPVWADTTQKKAMIMDYHK